MIVLYWKKILIIVSPQVKLLKIFMIQENDEKLRALMIKKGAIRFNNLQFPKDKNSRYFNSSFYQRMLPNGEKYDRK